MAPYGAPIAVVRPQSTEEVRNVVRRCLAHRIPVVPRGAGTGLSGGANAVDGAIVLSFEDMNRIVHIDAAERPAVVQPGVVNDDPAGGLRGARALVSAGSRKLALVDARRECRDERRGDVLRQVRRDA